MSFNKKEKRKDFPLDSSQVYHNKTTVRGIFKMGLRFRPSS